MNATWPSVSVPVLSVNRTSTLPRSSMQTSRFTITCCCARRRAPVARLTVTIAGSSCGVSPTAIASAKSADCRTERPSTTLITKIEPARIAVTVASIREKSESPRWKDVCSWRSPSRSAILPNSVLGPVPTTSPRPAPPRTSVPMKAHEGNVSGDPPCPGAFASFSAAWDSPVSTDSSHSSWWLSIRRRSAGTTSPTPRCTTSPGTSFVTSICCVAPPRSTKTRWRICACSDSTAFSERYSFTKLRPMLSEMIPPMIPASVRSPTTAEIAAAATSRSRR